MEIVIYTWAFIYAIILLVGFRTSVIKVKRLNDADK